MPQNSKWIRDFDKRIKDIQDRIDKLYKFIEIDIKNDRVRNVAERFKQIEAHIKNRDAAVHQRQGFLMAVDVIERATGIQYVG